MTMNKFLEKELKLPYCKGCSHSIVIKKLAIALEELDLSPSNCILVTDIGCVGLADPFFKIHTVHTLHGRSTAIAAGIKMSEASDNDRLKVIVFIGDGGATIGLLHLVEAARMNIDIKVILHNNFLYGMTGGQHSAFTPLDFITRTTREGNPFPSLDIPGILQGAHAPFLARATAQDNRLKDYLKEALNFKGFSLIEVIEICAGFAAKYNRLGKRELEEILLKEGKNTGIIVKDERKTPSLGRDKEIAGPQLEILEERFSHSLEKPFSLLIAGSAGEGVQFSSEILAKAAILSGLYVTQKNDNPVTVASGFSTGELKFSREEINYTGIERPDFVLVTSEDGIERIEHKLKGWEMIIIADESLKNPSGIKRDFRRFQNTRSGINIAALSFFLLQHPFIPFAALEYSLKRYGEEILDIARTSHCDRF